MIRYLLILLGLSGLLLTCYIVMARTAPAARGPVYTLPELRAHLERQPGPWLGRPLRVWALAQPCPT